MKGLCAIISGGELSPMDDIFEAEHVIACDSGYEYARRAGIKPDLLLGDFDSYRGALPNSVPLLRLPVEKDDTDTMSAMRHALDAGYKHIRIYCALGGRLDHLFANIQTAAFGAARGALVELIGRDTVIYVMAGAKLSLPPREGWSLSVFSLSDVCRGVTLKGVKYELDSVELTNRFPIGTSNEREGTAEISAEDGILAVMLCRLPEKL